MTMADKVFCDTNIILRAYHDTFPEHIVVKEAFDGLLLDDYDLWISRQIIREYLVQVTQPRTFDVPLTGEQAVKQVSNILQTCRVADETDTTTHTLFRCCAIIPSVASRYTTPISLRLCWRITSPCSSRSTRRISTAITTKFV